jgi:hypothetical protein
MGGIADIIEVEHRGGHRLFLRFDDQIEGELDFSNESWVGVFAPLADPDYFSRVSLDQELGTIVWPNGADFAPDTLHDWIAGHLTDVPT